MSSKRDTTSERRSPDAFSTSSVGSSTKNANPAQCGDTSAGSSELAGACPRANNGQRNMLKILREMDSARRVLDSAQLHVTSGVENLNSVADESHEARINDIGPCSSPSTSANHGALATSIQSAQEIEVLLQNQQILMNQIAESRLQLSALEQQYRLQHELQQQSQSSNNSLRSDVPLGVRPASIGNPSLAQNGAHELQAVLRVSQDANRLVDYLSNQAFRTAAEYTQVQNATPENRLAELRDLVTSQQKPVSGSTGPVRTNGLDQEGPEDVFIERSDPEGGALVAEDNKQNSHVFRSSDRNNIGSYQSLGLRHNSRNDRVNGTLPMSAPYTSAKASFHFPENHVAMNGAPSVNVVKKGLSSVTEIEDKLRKLHDTRQKIDELCSISTAPAARPGAHFVHTSGPRNGLFSSSTPFRPVARHAAAGASQAAVPLSNGGAHQPFRTPMYGSRECASVGSYSVDEGQLRRRQQLLAINDSLQHIEAMVRPDAALAEEDREHPMESIVSAASQTRTLNPSRVSQLDSTQQHQLHQRQHCGIAGPIPLSNASTAVPPVSSMSANTVLPATAESNQTKQTPQNLLQQGSLQFSDAHCNRRNLSLSDNLSRSSGVRPRLGSCNNSSGFLQQQLQQTHQASSPATNNWNGGADPFNRFHPMFQVPFRGSNARSLTEAATWGGSSTQDNSDNAGDEDEAENDRLSEDCSDSEMGRFVRDTGSASVVACPPRTAVDSVSGGQQQIPSTLVNSLRTSRSRRELEASLLAPIAATAHLTTGTICENCNHLAAYTQMLTLSLVQANEVICGQQRELERIRALTRQLAIDASATPGERPLNNQIIPGVRANNYVDNLKSFSTLNLLNQHPAGVVGLSDASLGPEPSVLRQDLGESRKAISSASTLQDHQKSLLNRNSGLDSAPDNRHARRPIKNSFINQVNFCRYSSNPELNRDEEQAVSVETDANTSATTALGKVSVNANALSGDSATNANINIVGSHANMKVSLAPLSRERLELQPALDAAAAFLATRAGQMCTPDVLIDTCRCLLDHLIGVRSLNGASTNGGFGLSHRHVLRVVQPSLGQFLARPVDPFHIIETLTTVLQNELASQLVAASDGARERASGTATSGVSDRSTAGNGDPTEDADGTSAGDLDVGEDVAEADRRPEDFVSVNAKDTDRDDDNNTLLQQQERHAVTPLSCSMEPGSAGSVILTNGVHSPVNLITHVDGASAESQITRDVSVNGPPLSTNGELGRLMSNSSQDLDLETEGITGPRSSLLDAEKKTPDPNPPQA